MFSELPVLQLKYDSNKVNYRWIANIDNFNMPIKAGLDSDYHFIYPTSEWQSESIEHNSVKNWNIDTDRLYIEVEIVE